MSKAIRRRIDLQLCRDLVDEAFVGVGSTSSVCDRPFTVNVIVLMGPFLDVPQNLTNRVSLRAMPRLTSSGNPGRDVSRPSVYTTNTSLPG